MSHRILILDDEKYWTVCISDLRRVNVTRIMCLDDPQCCTVCVSEPERVTVTRIRVPKNRILVTIMHLFIGQWSRTSPALGGGDVGICWFLAVVYSFVLACSAFLRFVSYCELGFLIKLAISYCNGWARRRSGDVPPFHVLMEIAN